MKGRGLHGVDPPGDSSVRDSPTSAPCSCPKSTGRSRKIKCHDSQDFQSTLLGLQPGKPREATDVTRTKNLRKSSMRYERSRATPAK